MAGPPKLQLRVLYTINSSPQYILARSCFSIPVTPIPELKPDEKNHVAQPKYATVSLKACLDTICRSSPELIQDNNRDYSVYVLDPLESNSAPAPVNISSSNNDVKSVQAVAKPKEHHYGVAVGLGLMSWALRENDDAVVTGTQVKLNTGQEALEVIFALRETAAMRRNSLSSTMKSWGIPLMGMSSHSAHSQDLESPSTVDPNMLSLPAASREYPGPATTSQSTLQREATFEALTTVATRHNSGQRRKVSRPSTALSESDKIMFASETYIGPLKKKGRPRNSKSNGKPPKKSATGECMNISSAPKLDNLVQNSESQEGSHLTSNAMMTNTPLRFLTSTLPTPDASQGQVSLLDLLAAISKSQNAHLLAALSTIDSNDTNQQQSSEPNPALVNAIGQLLLTAYGKQPSQPANVPPPNDFDSAASTSQDEDIVILDKENVDPMAFRRRDERGLSDIKGNKSVITNDTPSERHLTPNVLGPRSDGQDNSTSVNAMKRKRTLSDFMDEKESERSKQKEKERSEKREPQRHSTQRRSSSSGSIYDTGLRLRHYPRLTDEVLPMPGTNSYYRKSNDFRSSPPRLKVESSSMSSNSRRSTMLPSYSAPKAPASSPPRPSAGRPPRKRYVIPEWARTDTATQPRLSEEAQRALAEAEERKKKEREEKRKAVGYKRLRQESRVSRAEQKAKQLSSPSVDVAIAAEFDPLVTRTASQSCPVFATTDIATDIFSSLSKTKQLSPPCRPPSCPASNIPQTPPPKCASTLFTPENRDNAPASLFTPTPRGRTGWSGSAGSILFTPRKQMPPSPSPSTTRGKANTMSPIQAVISGETIDGASRWNGEDKFCWDEPDGPPSSLPTASDAEDEPRTSSMFEPETNDVESGDADDEDEQEYTVKQHWPGLPPSSPPPPSSPTLAPQDPDDEDVELIELPAPTSDIDESNTASSNEIQEQSDDDDKTIKDEFDSFMLSLTSDGSLPSDMDIFNNFPEQKNGNNSFSMLDPSLDPILQNGVVDFDFTEFWESFKPMVQDFVKNAPGSDKADPDGPQSMDHTKLAEDVHALLSGCLM